MKNEKIKAKEKELINLVSGFCDAELDEEYKDLRDSIWKFHQSSKKSPAMLFLL